LTGSINNQIDLYGGEYYGLIFGINYQDLYLPICSVLGKWLNGLDVLFFQDSIFLRESTQDPSFKISGNNRMSFKVSTRVLFLIIAIISIIALVIIQSNTIEQAQKVKNTSNLSLPIDEKTLINISVMVIFCIGFTFTYMIEGFPNFAHTSYAVIGSMVSFYLTRFLRINPYYTWGLATIFGGVIGIILYIFVVKPIKRHGGYQDITLTLTFLVIALVIPSIAGIFNFWARFYGDIPTRGYNLRVYDFDFRGISGIAIISPVTCILLILVLHYFLTENKIGISLRATAEDESLAATLGINTLRAHIVSWFISGALAALAGSIMTIRGGMGLGGADDMIVSIMSGSILGGTSNIYGAIIGGLFVALGQDILKNIAFTFLGLPALKWQGLLPIFFLVFSMTLFPNGLLNGGNSNLRRIKTNLKRLFVKD
jgi:branched-chain amino acid transport system permease protein